MDFTLETDRKNVYEKQMNTMLSSTVIGVELHRLGLKFNFGQVEVHRGEAEVYLSSLRVNIAEESVVDHRVQLQCKFDEKEGKYTEAKPRCTCPYYESNLHKVGEVQHQLPSNLMLVHKV